MNGWVKGIGLAMLALGLAAAVTVLVGIWLGERKMARRIALNVADITLPEDAASIAHGRYLFNTRGCATCHGRDGSGAAVIDYGTTRIVSPNITAGANSAITRYRTPDWVRTLRHGVKPDGRPLLIMPSEDYSLLSDADMGALIAYARQLAPVSGQAAEVRLPVAVKVMYAFGAVRDAAETIDHTAPPAPAAAPAVTIEHGAYVAYSCIGCHGENLTGGRIPGTPSTWPAPANLTPGYDSAMTRYRTPDSFMAMLRNGRRPDGSTISPVMPFAALGEMNEVDMRALHAYLQSLPPRAGGQR
ncbi:c-type cytochrome [Massilia sp. CCM 9210]|uniref:c-type cytochrome n=1 Tax=Massilia scottii TaxID=3057166 RepID=UPI002796A396|nr:c-type cytochrome [Massilia sp. CCM 9210]MDQ1817915.1 c-type cytochrome [Massilia sp. CCM 9210]